MTSMKLTLKDAIRYLMLYDPDLTSAQIQERLVWLGFDVTKFVVSHFRSSFRDDVRFLRKLGLLRNREPRIPDQIRNLKLPEHEPAPRYHYGRQSRDD